MCYEYDVDAETFIEQWMAFSLNKLNGAPPTLENLESLARKEFSKRTNTRSNATAKDALQSAGTGLTVYGTPASASAQYPFSMFRVLRFENIFNQYLLYVFY